MGVLADAVSEVLELGEGEIEPPPPFGTKVAVDYLTGMGKVGKGFVLLLDLDRALSADEKDLVFRPSAEAVPPRPAQAAAAT
jgi:purine-binding chemotaxis protein CheW